MLAKSLKVRGLSCFKNEWVGFDAFKPITVIVGRNNAGKSQLLDLVEDLTRSSSGEGKFGVQCTGLFDEGFLRSIFRENTYGGDLGGDHWNHHGIKLCHTYAKWEIGPGSDNRVEFCSDSARASEAVQLARQNRILNRIASVPTPFYGKEFCRILADRDVIAEEARQDVSLSFNGVGATNVIRRFITSSSESFPEDLIQVDLLKALSEIFGKDGEFNRIEIRQHDDSPDQKWEVFLGEPRKGLIPLSRSGSGLKTVILVLLNLLVIPKMKAERGGDAFVFAFEELENNLHPALLRRLFRYIAEYVERAKCFVLLTTHSSVAIDFFGTLPNTQIVYVAHDGVSASTKTIAAHFDSVQLINELGAKPSDLLQANGIIWLEGPSDRIYLNRFIELYGDGKYREGRDYQCAYYGGSVLAATEFSSPEEADSQFANLLRLNNNVAVICDGDRTAARGKGAELKDRVKRIKSELEQIGGSSFLWITDAKEIENYIPGVVWQQVWDYKDPVADPTKFDKFPTGKLDDSCFVTRELKRKSFDKCEFATAAAPLLSRALLDGRFDLKEQMVKLIAAIQRWND